ncbi:MAG: hypothetical protein Q9169_006873, partial [Polycauliona sp. 2 TL-2023]
MKRSLDDTQPPPPPPPRKRQRLLRSDFIQLNNHMSSMNLNPSFPFLHLPGEIRNQIYEMCLVVHGTINPHPNHQQENRIVPKGQSKPSVALLRVSKQVKAEAQPILFGKNTWLNNQNVINLGFTGHQYLSMEFEIQKFWVNVLGSSSSSGMKDTPMGPLVIAFGYRDLNQDLLRPLYASWSRAHERRPTANRPQATSVHNAHDEVNIVLFRLWHLKMNTLIRLAGRPLPPSKFWPVWSVSIAQREAALRQLRKVEIEITGLLDEEERMCLETTGFPASRRLLTLGQQIEYDKADPAQARNTIQKKKILESYTESPQPCARHPHSPSQSSSTTKSTGHTFQDCFVYLSTIDHLNICKDTPQSSNYEKQVKT